MEKINLIPSDLRVGGITAKIVKKLNMFSLGGVVVLVVVLLGFLGVYIYNYLEIKKLNETSDSLKNQISALENSQSMLVFAKDRLGKIKKAKGGDTAIEEIDDFKVLYSFLKSRDDISITEVNIESAKLELSISAKSLSSFTAFFKNIHDTKDEFGEVELSNFAYSPTSGLVSSLVFKTE